MDFSSSSQHKPFAPLTDKPRWGKPSIHDNPSHRCNISSSYAPAAAAVGEASAVDEREHMFDKVVTPSDVGKLNRLVIPKQHAEKYFPLDPASGEKGLLLNFEDRTGKSWRFRYSYWNSSQSYVMTKGWSRFVKDKKLDAGDVVSFHRGAGGVGKDSFYIDWKRRPDRHRHYHHHHHAPETLQLHHHSTPWSYTAAPYAPPPFLLAPTPLPPYEVLAGVAPPTHHHLGDVSGYRGSYGANYGVNGPNCQVGSRAGAEPMVFESVPVVHGKVAAKRLRLFGVNMDCSVAGEQEERETSTNAALQLRFHNGVPASITTTSTIGGNSHFLDKGKSSLSMDCI